MNVLNNYIPNEIIGINEKDPPQFTKAIKDKINLKDSLYRRYLQGGKRFVDLEVLNNLTIFINNKITNSKKNNLID